jgi:Flp pilus assembly protein TadD
MATGVLTYSHLEIEASGPGRPLAILFADGEQRPGTFGRHKAAGLAGCNRISLNPAGKRWYQDGIPGLGNTVESAAVSLRKLIDELAPSHVVTIGAAMGGYAALAIGSLIRADRIAAFGAETQLMLPGSRSEHDLRSREPKKFLDLLPHLQDRRPASVWLAAGEADIIDMYCAAQAARLPAVRAVSIRAAGHLTAHALDESDPCHSVLRAALDPSAQLPPVDGAGDLIDDGTAVAAAYEAHMALIARHHDAAERHTTAALDRRPDWPLAHHLHGRALALLGHHTEAEAAQARAVALDPRQAVFHHHLGLALAHQARFSEAATAQYAAIQLGFTNPWALHHLGVSLQRSGDVAGAEAAHRRAVERRPKSALFHHHLAIALVELGRAAEAELSERQAIALDPDNGDFHRQLGRILKAQGRLAEADDAYAHARDIDPDGAAPAAQPPALPPPSRPEIKDLEGLPPSVAALLERVRRQST